MRYEFAEDLQKLSEEISILLFPHVRIERVKCFRSFGTSSRRTIARCHALGKLMQMALEVDAFYPLEFLSERFDKLSFEEQIKVIIHELMHIPKTFGGGFRHHDFVTDKNVNLLYKQFISLRDEDQRSVSEIGHRMSKIKKWTDLNSNFE
jgi:predicted metallopeptidase